MDKGRIAVAGAMVVTAVALVGMYELTEGDPLEPQVRVDDALGPGLPDGFVRPDWSGPIPEPPATGSTSTTTTIVRRHEPNDLGVVLDPDGRPYDATGPDVGAADIVAEPITTLSIGDGMVFTTGGEYVTWPEDPARTHLDTDEVRVTMIWQTTEVDGDSVRDVLGLRLDAPGADVARWGPFEPAYGTDGGMGGLLTSHGLSLVGRLSEEEGIAIMDDYIDGLGDYELLDLDDDERTDAIIFNNGWGDGGFPKSTGYSVDGRAVSLVIWRTDHPWRLAFPDGTPPADVTAREDELKECLDGERGVDDHGWCVTDGEGW